MPFQAAGEYCCVTQDIVNFLSFWYMYQNIVCISHLSHWPFSACTFKYEGARDSAVGWGTVVKDGKSRIRFRMK
jgi:hypothetical protein